MPLPQAKSEGELSLQDAWRILRKRRKLFFSALIFCLAAAIGVTVLMPRKYDAVARLANDFQNTDSLGVEAGGGITIPGLDADVRLQTQVEILRSKQLAWRVIDKLHLDRNDSFLPRKFPVFGKRVQGSVANPRFKATLLRSFETSLKVEAVPKTQIIQIAFRSTDPSLAKMVTDELMHEYIEENFKTKFEATAQASAWLSKQLDDLKDLMTSSQEKLVQYQRKTGIVGTDQNNNTVVAKLLELNKGVAAAQTERIVKEARDKIAATGDIDAIAEALPNSSLAALRIQQAELNKELALATQKYGPAYPRMQQLRDQLAQVQTGIAQVLNRERVHVRAEFLASRSAEQAMEQAFETQKKEALAMNDASIDFAILKREADSSRELYEGLQGKLKQAGILAGLHTTSIRIVDSAQLPAFPASPRVAINLLVGLIAGLLSGLGMAFGLETMDATIYTPEDVEVITTIPSLGVIPLIGDESRSPAGSNLLPAALGRPKSEVSEAFRSLRTSLLLSSVGHAPQVLVITSALPSEGKSTVSSNTAVVLAQRGSRVLLVDGDLRRSSLHRLFNVGTNRGLSGYLTSGSNLKQFVVPIESVPGLYLLPAGTSPPYPSELLGSSLMKQLIEEWRGEFDHIVIDTPPMLAVTDAALLGQLADFIVVVARSARTTKFAIRRISEILATVQLRRAGIVVNALDMRAGSAYSYYGYYSSSRYGGYYHDEIVQSAGQS